MAPVGKTAKIAVIGSGAMGTAFAKILHDAGYRAVVIYGIVAAELAALETGRNPRYFPTAELPRFATTSDLRAAVAGAALIVLAVPSVAMQSVLSQITAVIDCPTIIVSGAKGFFPGTLVSVHEGIAAAVAKHPHVRGVVSLIGPSFAEEIIAEAPTSIAAVSTDLALATAVQAVFVNTYFRTYTQTDVKGAMTCAIFKNVLALAAGMMEALVPRNNTRAALLARGIKEMAAFVALQGGAASTALSLAGVGDLILTATSPLSRNFSAGRQVATQGAASLDGKATIEGVVALKTVYEVARAARLSLPIIELLYQIIVAQTLAPADFPRALWATPLSAE